MGDSHYFITSEDLARLFAEGPAPRVIDVRKAPDFEAAQTVIVTAAWRDPAAIESWWRELPADVEIIVYCVHGHEVSQGATEFLRRKEIAARYLQGGFEGFVDSGGATVPKQGLGNE